MTINSNRLIGDFIEINADISRQEQSSKLPKFIKSIRAKRYRRRLIKSAEKIPNSNIILDKENLYEFFIFCSNNYKNGNFRSIYKVLVDGTEYNKVEAVIKFDSYYCIIDIYKDTDSFDVVIRDKTIDENRKSCSITVNELISRNNKTSKLLEELNRELLDNISKYIIENIIVFLDREKYEVKYDEIIQEEESSN